jgi:hypothetical protein
LGGGDINIYLYAGGNPVNWVDPMGLAVIYGMNVVSNPKVRNALDRMDKALPGTDVIVTGGDRYYDDEGNIRSSSNHEIIPNSAPYTSHLANVGVDFALSNMTPSKDLLNDYFDWSKDYSDGHFHGDLRSENGGIVCPDGNPPTNPNEDNLKKLGILLINFSR